MAHTQSQEVLKNLFDAFPKEEYSIAIFINDASAFNLYFRSDIGKEESPDFPENFSIPHAFQDQIHHDHGYFLALDEKTQPIPEIIKFATAIGSDQIACLPVETRSKLYGFVMLGNKRGENAGADKLNPFLSAIKLASDLFELSELADSPQSNPAGLNPIDLLNSSNIASGDLSRVYASLHDQIRLAIGDFSFFIALYDDKTNSIRIPYLYEQGRKSSIDSFPLGEGLISILIRSKQPLLLNKDTENQATSLESITTGKPAKSWMGVPLAIEGQVLGALVLQDPDKEDLFGQEDLLAFSNFAQQISGMIQITKTIDENRRHLSQVLTAADIARDISSALNLDELLLKAVDLIRERFNFYHVAIFLVDLTGTNAVIREATGDAGNQLKRMEHKLVVGSKSIVGYVTSQGEPLIVNDTGRDAMYLPNPMLPETRAEAAIPLKIGERILGALDVQSSILYTFGSEEINSLQMLADQLAIALNNSELFAETQEHLSQHRLLHHITTSAASGSTLDEALSSTVQGLQVTMGGDRVVIFLVDDERKNLITKAYVGYSPETANKIIPIGSGITGWVAAHRKSLRINDVTQDARYIELSPNSKSELALPLVFRNELLGVLNVESEHIAAYSENDEEMLGTLAGSIAAIVANAKLIEQIRKQVDRERQLYEITSKIRRSTNVQSILLTTINELNRVTGAEFTQVKIGVGQNGEDDSLKERQSHES
jgi:GAF domain-containing protein